MDPVSYVIAWSLYLFCATGLVVVFWRMTRGIKLRRTRRALRAFVVAVFYTPVNIGQGTLWLAPAYLVGAYDWVLDKPEKAMEAGIYICAAFGLLIVVILLESVLRRLLGVEREA